MDLVSTIFENVMTASVLLGTMAQCAKQIRDNHQAEEYEEIEEDDDDDDGGVLVVL